MTMAPSTSMPTVSTRPNITIVFTVMPTDCRIRKPTMNEAGMEMPTSSADLKPSAQTITTMTRKIAVRIEDSSDPRISKMLSDLSRM